MKIIFYIPPNSNLDNKTLDLLSKITPVVQTEIHTDFDSLSEQLTKSTQDILMAVLFIPDIRDISLLLTIDNLLSELRTFLILPDRKKETLDRAYKLFPRYVCTKEESYKELTMIINKITQNLSIK